MLNITDLASWTPANIFAGHYVDGHNAAVCNDECGRAFELVDFDYSTGEHGGMVGGADDYQPDGFKCRDCTEWYANTCGNREAKHCLGCAAEAAAGRGVAA